MFLQLRKLVLWPKAIDAPPRIVDFELGSVNVITGASKTGKSAIIPIIDYCLGADRCAIPVKTIRDSCSWFGLVVQTDHGQRLFARREPGTQKSTGDMYVSEGLELEIPQRAPERNATADSVKQLLDEIAGLTQLEIDEREDSGFQGRPSFRDMAAFMFQPQNVVANPDVFFFKADTYEHQEKLRTIFPYVLGAVTPEILAKQQELRRLRRTLARRERDLSRIRDVSDRWVAEIGSKISTARELGLITADQSVPPDTEGRVDLLRRVAAASDIEVRATPASVSGAAEELLDLQNEEAQVSSELAQLRRRYSEMTRLRDAAVRHGQALGLKRDRLRISGWFKTLHEESHECPVCGNEIPDPVDEIQDLVNALEKTESETGDAAQIPAAFDREYERVKADIAQTTERLESVSIRRRALARRSDEVESQRYQVRSAWRFLGEMDEAISRYENLQSDSTLVEEVMQLQDSIGALERDLQRHNVQRLTDQAVDRVSLFAGRMLPHLDAESPDDSVRLSIRDLTVKVSGEGRDDYLWQMGSGANWLSYHVAVTLALQQHFLALNESPVPGLIVFDQPSQVYFPRRAGVSDAEGADPPFRDEDVQAVRRVLSVLAQAVGDSQGLLQAIVLDHASQEVWSGIEGINLVEEWRGDDKLVPLSWLAS